MNSTISEEACKKLGDTFMSPYFKQVKDIYVDLEACYDFKLGAILQMISTKVEYDYIMTHLDDYNKALDLKTTSHFPALKYEESNVVSFIQNHTRAISLGSPAYQLWNDFRGFILGINTFNQSKDTTEPVTIHFACDLFQFHEDGKKMIEHFIHQIDSTIIVNFLEKDITQQEPSFIRSVDVFIIYDIVKFFSLGTNTMILAKDQELLMKTVFSYSQCKELDKVEERLYNQKLLLSQVCDIAFVDRKLLTSEDKS